MVTDCVVKEYKLYDKETNTVANNVKELINAGYNVDVKYAAGNIGAVLIVATKEEIRTKSTKKKDSE